MLVYDKMPAADQPLSEIAKQLGARGGNKTLEKKGTDHFKRIAQLGAEAKRRKKEFDSTRKSNPLYWGRAALERDEYKCVDCGGTTHLVVHHIDGSGKRAFPNNKLDNLVTVCRTCHAKRHGHTRSENRAEIVALRESGMTLGAIGLRFGISRERVRQIYAKTKSL